MTYGPSLSRRRTIAGVANAILPLIAFLALLRCLGSSLDGLTERYRRVGSQCCAMKNSLRKKRGSQLFAFFPRSRAKKHPHDSTWHCSDTFSEPDLCQLRDKLHHEDITMDTSISALAKAFTFLRLGPRAKVSDSPEEHFPAQEVRIEDIFHSKLNKCNAEALPELRKQRAEIAPIVCYESDNEDNGNETTSAPTPTTTTDNESFASADFANLPHIDVALQARMDALLVQQQLLGSDHPDVQFLANHIRQHRRRLSSTTSSGSAF